jgi:putative ATP-dependent endonuclease of OLD family
LPTISPDVLQKAQKDLKVIVKAKGLETQCNQTENPSMRHAIYGSFADLKLQLSDVPLNEDNGKAIWKALLEYIPHYALFQSDRPSSDQDPEVQNPMKIAIEQALDQLTQELDTISDEVRKKAEETANRTLRSSRLTIQTWLRRSSRISKSRRGKASSSPISSPITEFH